MSQFKIKQYSNQTYDHLISRVLTRSKIDNQDLYLSPTYESLQSPYNYKNMDKGVTQFLEAIALNKSIGILVDPDVDGLCSSAMLHILINKLSDKPRLTILHHERKAHGLTPSIIKKVVESDIELLLIPDAGSNEYTGHQILHDNGIDFIVIDHHIIEAQSKLRYGIVINNQRNDNINPNTDLSGAGMVLQFCRAVLDHKGLDTMDKELFELASIGQIGDMLNTKDPEVRFIVEYGLQKMSHPLIKVIVEHRIKHVYFDPLDTLTSIDVAFFISPLFNAVARIGTIEDKQLLYNAMVDRDIDKTHYVEVRRKINGSFTKVPCYWDHYEYTFDVIKKLKSRQDNLSRKLEKEISQYLCVNHGIAVCVLEEAESKEAALLGLVANKMVESLGKPVIILREKGDNWVGSGRGDEITLESFKNWCADTGEVNFASGHDNAFGISISNDNLEDFIAKTLEVESKKQTIDTIYVDEIFDYPDPKEVEQAHRLRWIYNRDVDPITFGYKGIDFNKDFIRKRGSITTLWENGVEFIIFGDNSKMYNQLKNSNDFRPVVDIVGQPKMQYWNKNGKPQIIVDHIQLVE